MEKFEDKIFGRLGDGTNVYEVVIKQVSSTVKPSIPKFDLTRLESNMLADYDVKGYDDFEHTYHRLTFNDIACYICHFIDETCSLIQSNDGIVISFKLIDNFAIVIKIDSGRFDSDVRESLLQSLYILMERTFAYIVKSNNLSLKNPPVFLIREDVGSVHNISDVSDPRFRYFYAIRPFDRNIRSGYRKVVDELRYHDVESDLKAAEMLSNSGLQFFNTMKCRLDSGEVLYEVSIYKMIIAVRSSTEELDLTSIEKYLLASYFRFHKDDVDDALKLTAYDIAVYIYDIICNNPILIDSREKEIVSSIKIFRDYKISISIGEETWNHIVVGRFVYDLAEVITCAIKDHLNRTIRPIVGSLGIINTFAVDSDTSIIKRSDLGIKNCESDVRLKEDFSKRVAKVVKALEDLKPEHISDEEFSKVMNKPEESDLTICPNCGETLIKLSTGVSCMFCNFKMDNGFMNKPE